MEEKKVNLSISEGNPFFAHEASINYNPTQFVFDFRCVTPRIDPRSNDAPTIHMLHNVVMLDTFHAKKFHQILGEMISKYEKDLGKIEQSKAVKQIEKKIRKDKENMESSSESVPTYFR
jgi:hypothetical protein